MLRLSFTTRAVADAIAHYRELRQLTRDELSYVLSTRHHEIDTEDLRGIEQGLTIITVDDLMAIAAALDVTPVDLLAHMPAGPPEPEAPLGTGLPNDVSQPELRAWVSGRTGMDDASRAFWCEDQVDRLRILSTHLEEQLAGGQTELAERKSALMQDGRVSDVLALRRRIETTRYALADTDIALAHAEQRLGELRGVED